MIAKEELSLLVLNLIDKGSMFSSLFLSIDFLLSQLQAFHSEFSLGFFYAFVLVFTAMLDELYIWSVNIPN